MESCAAQNIGWTAPRVQLLATLWDAGLSASQIAGRLGGITRNAVIGKVHRLGLEGRATIRRNKKPSHKLMRFSEQKTPEPKPVPVQTIACADPLMVAFSELKRDMCHWPIGEPRDADFRYCGCAVTSGRYCEYHKALSIKR
jgi:GcrA cell cycle regulator